MFFRTVTKPENTSKIIIQNLSDGPFWVEIGSKDTETHYEGHNKVVDDNINKILFTTESINDIVCYVKDTSHVTIQGDEIE